MGRLLESEVAEELIWSRQNRFAVAKEYWFWLARDVMVDLWCFKILWSWNHWLLFLKSQCAHGACFSIWYCQNWLKSAKISFWENSETPEENYSFHQGYRWNKQRLTSSFGSQYELSERIRLQLKELLYNKNALLFNLRIKPG